eukprot:gene12319-15487_t
MRRAVALPPHLGPLAPSRRGPPGPKIVLYKGKGMLMFRFLVRAKVFQLTGFLTTGILASTLLSTDPKTSDVVTCGALAVGCIVTSYCLWYYSGRYVGELSLLLPDKKTLRFSVLDFWGNRQDNDMPLSTLDPPFMNRSVAQVMDMIKPVLMPLNVVGDRQYYISVAHGHLLQKEVLQKIMYGKFDPAEPIPDSPPTTPSGRFGPEEPIPESPPTTPSTSKNEK